MTIVIGLGSPDRGDDAVGALVARAVGTMGLVGVRVEEHEDPTSLIDLWADADLAVVVDAVVSGREPGEVHLLETGADAPALAAPTWNGTGGGGTHAFGLGAAVELARALRRLPRRLVVVGIEAAGFEHGAPLSGPVAAAVPAAVRCVVEVVTHTSDPYAAGPATRRAQPAARHTGEAGHVPR